MEPSTSLSLFTSERPTCSEQQNLPSEEFVATQKNLGGSAGGDPPSTAASHVEDEDQGESGLSLTQIRQQEMLSYALSMALSAQPAQNQLNSPVKIISKSSILLQRITVL